jgi:predicted Rossmann-fold nucleotide-binding protein
LRFCSIFRSDTPLAKVVEDMRKLGGDLSKQDHIVIVGGGGNSLDINQY